MNDTELKFIEIETKIAFQEQTIDQLNDVIIDQQRSIEALQLQIKRLNTKFEQESQNWGAENNPIDEKPPHY